MSGGARMLEEVRAAALGRRLIAPGDRGVVALSGGPDSLCLLDLLVRMSDGLQLELIAAIVDHGLREGSEAEAQLARQAAESMGVRAVLLQAEGIRERRGNLQQEARHVRLSLLAQLASRDGARWVALGHTASDQAETLIMRMIRGAGVAGMGGIPRRSDLFIRPLLDHRRDQIERYLSQRGLTPLMDPSNSTDRFLRNRVRRSILPLLEQENPRITDSLCRLAGICRREDAALDHLAEQTLAHHRSPDGVHLEFLSELPPGLQLRISRLIISWARGDLRGIEGRHVELLSSMLKRPSGHSALDLPGIQFQREYQHLRWSKNSVLPLEPLEISQPGRYRLSNGRYLHVNRRPVGVDSLPLVNGQQELAIAENRLTFPLIIRSWRRGDRIAIGPGKRKKVARLLMDAKIPHQMRDAVPLLISAGTVILVVGIRMAYGYAPDKKEEGWTITLNNE